LAEELAQAAQKPPVTGSPGPVLVNQLRKEGVLRLSARHPQWLADPNSSLDVSTIPDSASCQVIYAPPFYLVHTPGLFEGALARTTLSTVQRTVSPMPHGRSMKI
jgi:hypothetical protein